MTSPTREQSAIYARNNSDKIVSRILHLIDIGELQKAKNMAMRLAKDIYPDVQPCEVDGCKWPGERHHDDYSRPLDIRWLCRSHHLKQHRPKGWRPGVLNDRSKDH